MSETYSSEHQKQHDFFITLKRYAQRLNQEKKISLSYLQTINKLSSQISQKDKIVERLLKENQELKEKLSIYEQVMTRSRIMINSGGNKNLQNHSTMAFNVNTKNNFSPSPRNHYGNLKFSRLIDKQKFTESFVETRNQLQYLKQYDQEAYEQLSSKIKNQSEPLIQLNTSPNKKQNKIFDFFSLNEKVFPIFQDFIILKPNQNINSSPDSLHDLKLVFSMSNKKQIKKGNKLFQSISTYLCHNNGPQWVPQEYKTQIITNVTTTTTYLSNNSFGHISNGSKTLIQQNILSPNEDIYIYLSNSEQTLQPILHSSQNQLSISPVYLQFNPSLYYFGFCYKSHCLEYMNGRLYRVPILYTFVTRYPFLSYWRQLLQLIVERLDIKNEKDLQFFKKELEIFRQKSLDRHEGFILFEQGHNKKLDFEFHLLQKNFAWKKIIRRSEKDKLLPPIKKQIKINKTPSNQSQDRHSFISSPFQGQNQISQVILNEIVSTFTSYNIELVIDVLLLLLLEIPIAIISQNESLLQKFMLYFVYIIKPLKYPFPIIFNLPVNMAVVLQSPFPSFLGVTDQKIIEPYIFERTVFDLDEKIAKSWPNIDFYNQSRQSVVRWVNKMTENDQNQMSKLEKINEIVKILITSSKFYPEDLKELRTYRKYFKKTQIWHIFNHSHQQKIAR